MNEIKSNSASKLIYTMHPKWLCDKHTCIIYNVHIHVQLHTCSLNTYYMYILIWKYMVSLYVGREEVQNSHLYLRYGSSSVITIAKSVMKLLQTKPLLYTIAKTVATLYKSWNKQEWKCQLCYPFFIHFFFLSSLITHT